MLTHVFILHAATSTTSRPSSPKRKKRSVRFGSPRHSPTRPNIQQLSAAKSDGADSQRRTSSPHESSRSSPSSTSSAFLAFQTGDSAGASTTRMPPFAHVELPDVDPSDDEFVGEVGSTDGAVHMVNRYGHRQFIGKSGSILLLQQALNMREAADAAAAGSGAPQVSSEFQLGNMCRSSWDENPVRPLVPLYRVPYVLNMRWNAVACAADTVPIQARRLPGPRLPGRPRRRILRHCEPLFPASKPHHLRPRHRGQPSSTRRRVRVDSAACMCDRRAEKHRSTRALGWVRQGLEDGRLEMVPTRARCQKAVEPQDGHLV